MVVYEYIITIICSVLASSGVWALIEKLTEKKDAKSAMLLGLAHDRILSLGRFYLDRGYITDEEFENLHDYLYIPYTKLGGNGAAKRIVELVRKLPSRPSDQEDENVK